MKRKLFATLLALIILLGALPASFISALAESMRDDPLPALEYVDADGNPHTQDAYSVIDPEHSVTSLTDGWYAMRGQMTLDAPFTVVGEVNLVICDDADVWIFNGIRLGRGATLTIWGQKGRSGKLGKIYSKTGPGIEVPEGTSLIINGGNITASGAPGAAGIGGGAMKASGSITINNGTVFARGGVDDDDADFGGGAGIGGGYRAMNGRITINGGEVVSEAGGMGGSGIGAGAQGDQYHDIVITDETVTNS